MNRQPAFWRDKNRLGSVVPMCATSCPLSPGPGPQAHRHTFACNQQSVRPDIVTALALATKQCPSRGRTPLGCRTTAGTSIYLRPRSADSRLTGLPSRQSTAFDCGPTWSTVGTRRRPQSSG